ASVTSSATRIANPTTTPKTAIEARGPKSCPIVSAGAIVGKAAGIIARDLLAPAPRMDRASSRQRAGPRPCVFRVACPGSDVCPGLPPGAGPAAISGQAPRPEGGVPREDDTRPLDGAPTLPLTDGALESPFTALISRSGTGVPCPSPPATRSIR